MPIERTTGPGLPADRADPAPSPASRPTDPPAAARFAQSLERGSQPQKLPQGPASQGPASHSPAPQDTVGDVELPPGPFEADRRDAAESANPVANPGGRRQPVLRRAHPPARQTRSADPLPRPAGVARERYPADPPERLTSGNTALAASPVPFGQPGVAARDTARAAPPRTEPDAAEQKQFARFAAAIAEPGASEPTDTLSVTFSRGDALLSSALVERSADARLAITLTQNTPGSAGLPLPAIASLERRLQKRGLSGYRLAVTRKTEADTTDRDA